VVNGIVALIVQTASAAVREACLPDPYCRGIAQRHQAPAARVGDRRLATGGPFWNGVFDAVQKQGKSPPPDKPKSPSDVYFANLNKADKDPRDGSWYLLFDMVPAEAALLGLGDRSGDGSPPPPLPTILFHATEALQQNVYGALGLGSGDEPAEGSWYALYLQPGGDPKTDVTGELYHPDADFGAGITYKTWHIAAADLMFVPVQKGPDVVLGLPPTGASSALETAGAKKPRTYAGVRAIGVPKARRFRGFKRRRAITALRRVPPPPPAPPAGSGAIGVMDIGQGGCNLVFDRNLEPFVYYDAGYPLGFFRNSLPLTMRADLPGQFLGPIYQNAGGNLSLVLSHWDWDHWRLGNYTSAAANSLAQLPWTVPHQPMGPTATGFLNGLANAVVVAGGAPAQALGNGMICFKNVPPVGAIAAVLINNSGLSVRIPVDLAGQPAAPVLLTGDGNISGLPLAARFGLAGIGAVHHGSGNHGADQNLPAAPFFGPGYIAYSYGISSVTGNHAYGFPVPAAVANYHAANWTAPNAETTAEGANINAGPAAHGNIRMGNQGALHGNYLHTAFFAIGHALP
jgi:hypothetical protein